MMIKEKGSGWITPPTVFADWGDETLGTCWCK